MVDIYLHGIETVERNNGPRPVETIDTGVIGLIGTAPDANVTNFPLDTPILINGINGVPAGLGLSGTAPDALEAIFAQAGRVSQRVVFVRVTEGADAAATLVNVVGSLLNRTGIHAFRKAQQLLGIKPKILIAPGQTASRPTNGIASATVGGGGGTGYVTPPAVAVSGGGGSGAVIESTINVATGAVTGFVIVNPGQGYTTAPTLTLSGGGGTGATGTAVLGTVGNPAVFALLSVANALRAVAYVDGPNTTSAAALAYRQDFNTDRLYIIDPMVTTSFDGVPANGPVAALAAGLTARVDYEEGFWVSPSNHILEGVVGTVRTIEHSLSDPSAESQYLNRNDIATVVRSPSGGWKLWGNRVPNSDPLRKFLSVRRSHDAINESIEIAHEPFIDKPFSIQVLTDISETVNQALRRWKALGATLGGRVWFDPMLNTKETWAAGHLYVSYDAEAPAPIEHITFMFSRNTGYYEQLGQDAIREISRLAGRAVA